MLKREICTGCYYSEIKFLACRVGQCETFGVQCAVFVAFISVQTGKKADRIG
jgi:hypothetical protein